MGVSIFDGFRVVYGMFHKILDRYSLQACDKILDCFGNYVTRFLAVRSGGRTIYCRNGYCILVPILLICDKGWSRCSLNLGSLRLKT